MKQFVEWEAYDTLEPIGDDRASYERAAIAQMIFNMAVQPKDRNATLSEFVVFKGDEPQPKKPQTFQDQIAIAKIMSAAAAAEKRELGKRKS